MSYPTSAIVHAAAPLARVAPDGQARTISAYHQAHARC